MGKTEITLFILRHNLWLMASAILVVLGGGAEAAGEPRRPDDAGTRQ